ncbi:MAG: hypothetical protein JWL98_2271 [Xanthomonadaceae bacterium]|nr:hypothetical protein [Xanthomonadaceae bacterium]
MYWQRAALKQRVEILHDRVERHKTGTIRIKPGELCEELRQLLSTAASNGHLDDIAALLASMLLTLGQPAGRPAWGG